MKDKLKNLIKDTFVPRYFAALFLTYLIALYSIFRTNFNYIDDLGRALSGYRGWRGFSRYISDYLSPFIHTSKFLFDISPLTQLLAISIICISSLIVIRIIRRGEKISYWDLVTVLPIGLSPYFLECFSYKFDSPYMALSVLSSVLPLLFYQSNKVVYCITTFLGTLVMCTTYQAASGIFPMFVLLVSFMMWTSKNDKQKILIFILLSAISYIIAIVVFKTFIMRPIGSHVYVSNEIASLAEIIAHYKRYLKLVKSDFRKIWIITVLALSAWFIFINTYKSKQNKFISLVVAAAVTVIMSLLSFGLYPILTKPLYSPRAMYGVGAYIAFISVGSIYIGHSRYVTRILTCVMAWLFITFSAAYGNALAVQGEYEDFRRAEIIYALVQLEQFNTDNDKNIQIVGNVGHAPAIRNAIRRCDMLRRLVPVTLMESWSWGRTKFMNYYNLKNLKYDGDIYEGSFDDFVLLHESSYHKIYIKGDNNFIIELK